VATGLTSRWSFRNLRGSAATLGLLGSLVAGGAAAQQQAIRKADFVDAQGKANGTARLSATASGGVLIRLEITGLPPGQWVAFHVHETGRCEHATGHDSAGGHFNPGGRKHGLMTEGGPHAGDMPNQYAGSDGTLRAEVYNHRVTLDKGEVGIVGRALMVHAKPDDHASQPSGDAGKRLACGVIE